MVLSRKVKGDLRTLRNRVHETSGPYEQWALTKLHAIRRNAIEAESISKDHRALVFESRVFVACLIANVAIGSPIVNHASDGLLSNMLGFNVSDKTRTERLPFFIIRRAMERRLTSGFVRTKLHAR